MMMHEADWQKQAQQSDQLPVGADGRPMYTAEIRSILCSAEVS